MRARLSPNIKKPEPSMHISPQGLVRLTYEALSVLPMKHLISGIDRDSRQEICGRPTELTGFTEWVTPTSPGLTIGWEWQIGFRDGQSHYERLGLPRTNIMLVNLHGQDHGWERSLVQLARYVDSMPWPPTVDAALRTLHSNVSAKTSQTW